MWRLYIGVVKWLARKAAPTGARYILDPCGFRRAVVASFAAFLIALTPLVAPAQLGSQSIERTLIQHDARIRALERSQSEMVSTLSRVAEQGAQLNRLSEQVAVLSNQITERDKFLAWLLGLINTVALITAGIAWMIRHRKPH